MLIRTWPGQENQPLSFSNDQRGILTNSPGVASDRCLDMYEESVFSELPLSAERDTRHELHH